MSSEQFCVEGIQLKTIFTDDLNQVSRPGISNNGRRNPLDIPKKMYGKDSSL